MPINELTDIIVFFAFMGTGLLVLALLFMIRNFVKKRQARNALIARVKARQEARLNEEARQRAWSDASYERSIR